MACLKFTPKRLTKEYCQCWTMSLIHYPLGTNWVLELVGTWLGLGQGCFGTKGLGPGLDNYSTLPCFLLSGCSGVSFASMPEGLLPHIWET